MAIDPPAAEETPQPLKPQSPQLPVDPVFEELKRKSALEKAKERKFNRIGLWVGMVGLALAIPSLIYGYLGYRASQLRPELTYAIYPIKTELQRPDFDQQFGFTYKGQPIDAKAVTAMQLAVWNAGTKSIRPTDLLERATLEVPKGTKILSARVSTQSREVCEFKISADQGALDSGSLPLEWQILEPGDGAIVQLIYVGDATLTPAVIAVVEGQRIVAEVPYEIGEMGKKHPRPKETLAEQFLIAGVMGCIIGVFYIVVKFVAPKNPHWTITVLIWIGSMIIATYMTAWIFYGLGIGTPKTPFGW